MLFRSHLFTAKHRNPKTYDSRGLGIPVLSSEEMAGLMVGMDPWKLGLQMHQIAVEPLLDKMGVNYAPKAKYHLASSTAPLPQKPSVLLV